MRLRESGPYSQRGMYLIKDITVLLDGEHGGKVGEEVDRNLQCGREQSQQSYEWHTRRTQGNFSLLKMHPLQQRRGSSRGNQEAQVHPMHAGPTK